MSSFICLLQPDQAIVATDTLAVSPDGAARQFTTKAFVLPHLKLIVAGTGVAGLTSSWFRHINERMVVGDVDHLNFHAEQSLQQLWDTEFSDPDVHELSTTIYHIGLSRTSGKIHGYSYSSWYGFESRPLSQGLSYKPAIDEQDQVEELGFLNIMEAQRETQARKPPEQRIYIGGEVQLITLDSKGMMGIVSQAQFDDFAQTEREIYENFKAHTGQ